jgi:hypothetical protein
VIIPTGYTFQQDGRFYKVRPIGSGTLTSVVDARMQCRAEAGSLPVPYPDPSYLALLKKYNKECFGYKIALGIQAIDVANKIFLTDNGNKLMYNL